MAHYYYCKGCDQVIVRKEPVTTSYCETSGKTIKMKALTQEEVKDLRFLQKKVKK